MSQVPPLFVSVGGTGSVYCGTGWYLVVLGQNRAVLVASVICFQKIYGLQVVNNQIIQYSEKETVIRDKSTDRQNLWKGSSKSYFSVYDSLSDVGESRIWFASKNLTPCRMH